MFGSARASGAGPKLVNERPIPRLAGFDLAAHRREPAGTAAVRRPFLDAIASRPLVLDAAMGTRLIERGLDLRDDDPALWVLSHPDEVEMIHRRDVAAGSEAVFTNTFGASRPWLDRFGRADDTEAINRSAVLLARRAAGARRHVIGTIGPAAALLDGAAAEQAAILVDAGVDALILETYRLAPALAALRAVSSVVAGEVPLCASLWDWPDTPLEGAELLLAAGAAVIGMNCQAGAAAALEFAGRLHDRVSCPLLVKPGARRPWHDDDTPAALARAVPGLLDRHVRLMGGCCGTTDRHVAELAAACAHINPSTPRPVAGESF